ncbi:hypothetical protein ACFU3E_01795 [Streptomyces sp. NPDC057424]|uniref:hypothetical protein n=1 Tax=Streptomyces sp. NPDC057424 TaxID=3346127 RepID=UPI00369B89DB
MSDNQMGPEEPVGPGAVSEPAPEPQKQPVRRGRVAAVTASVLLAVAVVGGAGYTVVAVNGADREAGAPVWTFPESRTAAGADEKAAPSGLAGMLVPYGTYGANGWGRGPDLGEYGSEAALSGKQATALRKESLSGLPRTQRKRLEKAFDQQRITGIAMRSYLSTTKISGAYTDDAFTVRVELAQMDDRAAVRDASRLRSAVLDALDVFRNGPKIKGHKNARCFLPPKDADGDLETMYCSAHVGNVLVTAVADGAQPLDTKGAAMLLRQQLDRIAEPGEAV